MKQQTLRELGFQKIKEMVNIVKCETMEIW